MVSIVRFRHQKLHRTVPQSELPHAATVNTVPANTHKAHPILPIETVCIIQFGIEEL